MKLGILPLGRGTFDVDYANEKLASMMAALNATSHEIVGSRALLMDEAATNTAIDELETAQIDRLLVLQVTFTDASAIVRAAAQIDRPLSIWAVPEPRLGGRLRLNAFCGLNLASHALGRNGRAFAWAYGDSETVDVESLLQGTGAKAPATKSVSVTPQGERIAKAVHGKRIARIGEHPAGFDTCAYDAAALHSLAGVSVDEIELDHLFNTARSVSESDTAQVREVAVAQLDGLDDVDQVELDRSLKLKVALDGLRENGGYGAFALRCWPETFTEYGGAICGPVSMMGEARIPCACEADVYGALTQLILQEAAQAPVFLTDLVDVDVADDSAVVWHCGQAPVSMHTDGARATIHTNRKMPLLYEFALKPGPVTLMRVSQALGEPKMVIARAEMLDREMAFTGTSGVLRFERSGETVLIELVASGLEHHMALAYGDHVSDLEGTAAALGLPVLRL